MPVSVGEFDVRRIEPATAIHRQALHLALDAEYPAPPHMAAPVSDLLDAVGRGVANIDLLFGAFTRMKLISAVLAVESPGRAALVSAPTVPPSGIRYRATVTLLREVRRAALARSLALIEALTAPGATGLGAALGESGFRHLTQLRYLRRGAVPRGVPNTVPNCEWTTYTSEAQPLFEAALERSYVQSMDCPELTGVRTTAEVLAGHRASGRFDPELWWVASMNEEPMGVVLLSPFSSGGGVEIIYMGVAQVARGTGVADALLLRAVEAAVRIKASVIALAVDERNTPARRLYRRWGFVETGARDAWVTSSANARD